MEFPSYSGYSIVLLSIIFVLLFILVVKSSKKAQNSTQDDVSKIDEQLKALFHKTIEQNGYMNSKIDEIGELTKKMTNAMTSNISDMGQMGEVILENILQDCGMTKNRDYKTQFTDHNEDGQKFRSDELKHRNNPRKKLDILFKINNGLFDYVAGEGSTIIDGFIRYRITVELEGPGSNPKVASADVTVQGLLLQSKKHNIVYGHRLEMPHVTGRDNVRVTVEIIDVAVHDDARLIFHAYGYGLLDGND